MVKNEIPTRERGRDAFEVIKKFIVLGPELVVEILVEPFHINMQLSDVTAYLLELLVLKIIKFGLDRFKVLLVLLVGLLDEVVHGRVLRIIIAYDPGDLKLFGEGAKYGLHSVQVVFVLQSYQCQLLIQSIVDVILDLVAGHHVVVNLEVDVVDLLAELVIELVRRVTVTPTHPLQIGRLLSEIRCQVLFHALDKRLKLFLLL